MARESVDIRVRMAGARAAARESKALARGMTGVGKGGRVAAGGVDRYGRSARAADRHTRGLGRGFVYARKGIGPLRAGVTGLTGALGFAGGVGLIGGFKMMVDEATEAQKTNRQTAAALKSTGAESWITSKALQSQATSLSNLAGVDDEAIQNGENLLLTFKNIRNEAGKGNDIFDQTAKTMVDFAARFTHGNMEKSATMLGKALDDPVRGATALRKVGVSLDEQAQDRIKTLVEENKMRAAQKLLLSQITPQIAGQAKASTTEGQKLKVTLANIAEELGLKLLPSINRGARDFRKWIKEVVAGTGEGGKFRDTVVSLAKSVWSVVKPVGQVAIGAAKFAAAHPGAAKTVAALLLLKKLSGIKIGAGVLSLLAGKFGGPAAGGAAAGAAGRGLLGGILLNPLTIAAAATALGIYFARKKAGAKAARLRDESGIFAHEKVEALNAVNAMKHLRLGVLSVARPTAHVAKLSGIAATQLKNLRINAKSDRVRDLAGKVLVLQGKLRGLNITSSEYWKTAQQTARQQDALNRAFDKTPGVVKTYGESLRNLKVPLDSLRGQLEGVASFAESLNARLNEIPNIGSPKLSAGQLTGRGNALGAIIPGYGGGDKIPRWLEPGEGIIRKEAVRRPGVRSLIDRLNAAPGMSTGGLVAPAPVAVGAGAVGDEIVIHNRVYLGRDGEREIARGVARVVRDDHNRR